MANITITIPDNVLQRTLTAICELNNYPLTVNIGTDENPNYIPNPQTRAQFAKAWLIGVIKHQVRFYESEIAAKEAKQATETTVDNEIDLT